MTSAADSLRDRMCGVSLGIFAADGGRLRDVADDVTSWGAAALHFDVMDGTFVPAITGGASFVAALDVGLPRDVHLLVERPSRHVAAFAEAGADAITVHAEAEDAAEAIAAIHASSEDLGRPILAGLAMMPGTAIETAPSLPGAAPDLVLTLAVDPRRGTPADVEQACQRLDALRDRDWSGATPLFVFDGGVTLDAIDRIATSRPDVVVSGSAVFSAADPGAACRQLAAAISAPH